MLSKRFSILTLLLFVAINFSDAATDNPVDPRIKVQVDSLNNISYTIRRTNPRLSLEYAALAYNICKEIDYPLGLAAAVHNRGIAKAFLGRFDTGLTDLYEAARIRESINDLEGLASTFNAIGFLFSEMNNDKKALEFYEKALDLRNKTNYKENLGILFNNIGWVHYRAGQLDLALEFFYRALTANQEDGDDRGVAATQSNIGNVYRRIGNYDKGLEYHFKALEVGQKFDDKYGIINTLRFIAEDYLQLKNYENATKYALNSLKLAQEIGSVAEEKYSASLLAQIFEARKNFPEATHYLKLVGRLNDSLFGIEKAEVLGHIQSVFELEAKEKENELLRVQQNINAQKIRMQRYLLITSFAFLFLAVVLSLLIYHFNLRLKHANQKLSQLNTEIKNQNEIIEHKAIALDEKNDELQQINQIKDKLISVIAHDLKNPLNSVIGYSEIIVSRFNSYSKEELMSFLRIINENALRSNMLLDNLLQWSRLQTKTLPFIPSEQMLTKLVNDELFFLINVAAEKKITIKTSIKDGDTVVADPNMIRTIIRNLISNAIKFSRKGGEIIISAKKDINETLISVKDNGMGVSHQVRSKLFSGEAGVSTPGTSGEKGTGLGLMLCKDFIDVHKGRIWFDSEPEAGSTFIFTIPNKSVN